MSTQPTHFKELTAEAVLNTLVRVTDKLDTSLRSPHELLAVLVHAIFVTCHFQLESFSEEGPTLETLASGQLVADWQQRHDQWTFRYTHFIAGCVLVRCTRMFDHFLAHAIATTHQRVYSVELNVKDVIDNQIAFPIPTCLPTPTDQLFTSQLTEFIQTCQKSLLEPLCQRTSDTGASSTTATSAEPPSRSHPHVMGTPHPAYVPFDVGSQTQGVNPLRVGDADLDPLSASPLFGGPHPLRESSGMQVGPEHPIFRREFSDPDNAPDQDIYGGPSALPPGSVPLGARFDPIGPFGRNPSLPPRPGRGGRGGPGGFIFSGDPDNDALPPPGYRDQFM